NPQQERHERRTDERKRYSGEEGKRLSKRSRGYRTQLTTWNPHPQKGNPKSLSTFR
ncbi:unnamed protein product, partial [Lactuca virosa]